MKIIIIIVVCLNFFLRIPFADSVTTFDETHIAFAEWVGRNTFNPFILKPVDKKVYDRSWMYLSYKPPVTILIPAIAGRLFGHYRIWGRIFVAFCSSLSLWVLYLLGRKFYSARVGMTALVLLCVNPLFFVQSFMYTDSVPLVCMTLMTLYAFFTSEKKWYWFAAGVLVLTKETGVLTIVGLCVYQALFMKWKSVSEKFKEIAFTAAPLVVFVGWVLCNLYILSVPLGDSYTAHKSFTLIREQFLMWSNVHLFFRILTAHWYVAVLYSLFFISVCGVYVMRVQVTQSKRSTIACMILLSCIHAAALYAFGCYSSTLDISPRYYLAWYAILALLVSVTLDTLIRSAVLYGAIITLLICTAAGTYFIYPNYAYTPVTEESRLYFDYIHEHIRLMRFLSGHVSDDSIVIASWPYAGYWMDPVNGFVSKSNRGLFCNTSVRVCLNEILVKPDSTEYHMYVITDSPEQYEELTELGHIYDVETIAEFGNNNNPMIHNRIVVSRVSVPAKKS